MDASRLGDSRAFDLLGQPWRLLRLDPTATGEQIHEAFSRAQQSPMAVPATLVFARDALLDPNRRLAYELTYPFDCPGSEVDAFYAALSTDESIEELLHFSDQLWPLARANFLAHVASHRPASSQLLYALLESHAAMDATDIYARLKTARAAAETPSPSLISVNEGLDELLRTHAVAALAGYDTVQDAAEPVEACTRQIVANGERHFLLVVDFLLRAYHQLISPLQTDLHNQIVGACTALLLEPNNVALVDELSNSVKRWTSLSRPLLVRLAQQGGEPDFKAPTQQLRLLIADLTESEHYQVALEIVEITRDFFSEMPTTIDQLADDARLIGSLSKRASIHQVQSIIDELEFDPLPLIAALEADGFGETSTGPAQSLWQAFLQATYPASASSTEPTWQVMHDFAIRLSNTPEAATAVVRLLAGLVEVGTGLDASPKILGTLRDNLAFMKSFAGTESAADSDGLTKSAQKKPFVSRLLQSRSARNLHLANDPNLGRKLSIRQVAFIAAVVLLALGAAAIYPGFDKTRLLWDILVARKLQVTERLGEETMPPVGTGQHLALDGVRYCHFQQERLRLIKPEVRGPEAARAYNLLIIDFNSRCSDYFYQDDDLKRVETELSSKKELLAADAKRIMSAWSEQLGTPQ
jgi:hypothetical protein